MLPTLDYLNPKEQAEERRRRAEERRRRDRRLRTSFVYGFAPLLVGVAGFVGKRLPPSDIFGMVFTLMVVACFVTVLLGALYLIDFVIDSMIDSARVLSWLVPAVLSATLLIGNLFLCGWLLSL